MKSDIIGLSLLHYREIARGEDQRGGSGMEHAEVLIHYADQPEGGPASSITRSEMRCKFPWHKTH